MVAPQILFSSLRRSDITSLLYRSVTLAYRNNFFATSSTDGAKDDPKKNTKTVYKHAPDNRDEKDRISDPKQKHLSLFQKVILVSTGTNSYNDLPNEISSTTWRVARDRFRVLLMVLMTVCFSIWFSIIGVRLSNERAAKRYNPDPDADPQVVQAKRN